jgi:hypothetical protein
MSKESYFEMCEMLGNEPIEAEIPVDFDDFPMELQQAMIVYRMLRDEWEGFNGLYLGKSFLGLTEIFEYTQISHDDRKLILMLIRLIDSIRGDQINKRQQKPIN